MGNYEQLKQAVSDVIKKNGNQEITGAILQNTLLSIISTVGSNATFAGIATPSTIPGTPDANVFYLAATPGIYSNFGGYKLTDKVVIFTNKNGNWINHDIEIATYKKVDDLLYSVINGNDEIIKTFVNRSDTVNYISEGDGYVRKDNGEIEYLENWKYREYDADGVGIYLITASVGSRGNSVAAAYYNKNGEYIGYTHGELNSNYNRFAIITPIKTKKIILSRFGGEPYLEKINSSVRNSLNHIYKLKDKVESIKALFVKNHFLYTTNRLFPSLIQYNNQFDCCVCKVFAGQTFTLININGDSNGRAYSTYDNNFNLIYLADPGAVVNETITIEQDGYLIINTKNSEDYDVTSDNFKIDNTFLSVYVLGLKTFIDCIYISDLDAVNKSVNIIKNGLNTDTKGFVPYTELGWISINKGYVPDGLTDEKWKHTDFIPLSDFTEIDVNIKGSSTGNIAILSYYSQPSNKYVLSEYTNNKTSVNTKLVGKPSENANYIRISGYKNGTIHIYQANHKFLAKTILLLGASFAYKANGWFEYSSEKAGFRGINKAVSGTRAYYAAINYDTIIGNNINIIDALSIMYTHDKDCYNADDLQENYEDYILSSSMSNAAAFDYIIKRYMADCLSIHKIPNIILCTHWHDGRTIYNNSVRLLAKKWSAMLVEFDNKTLSATQYHPTLMDNNGNKLTPSVINSLTPPDHPNYIITNSGQGCIQTDMIDGELKKYDAEVLNGKICAWHPDRRYKSDTEGIIDDNNDTGEYPYIQKLMGNIFLDGIKYIL